MELVSGILLSLACIGYNNTFNAWAPFQRALYVPLNLGFAAGTTALAMAAADLSRQDVGLNGDVGDASLAALAAVALTSPLFVIAASRHAHRIADRRVAALRGARLAYQVLMRVPLGTALTEEVVFRGTLFALWRSSGAPTPIAVIASSIIFGLWHIAPTVNLVRANVPNPTQRTVTRHVLGAIVFTTAAGVALCWLRLTTHGLVAPVVLHAGTNALGTIAAVVAARRTGQPT